MRVFCPGTLVIEGPSYEQDKNFAANIARDSALKNWPLVVLCDSAKKCARSSMNFLWTTFTRFEPAADMHAANTDVLRNHLAYTPPIIIDARMKPWYPKELFCDPETKDLVSRRWKEYFPAGQEMGDSDLAHLDAV
jgi:3-polyprenyl-4-hydroxybenzoate decarboxylase